MVNTHGMDTRVDKVIVYSTLHYTDKEVMNLSSKFPANKSYIFYLFVIHFCINPSLPTRISVWVMHLYVYIILLQSETFSYEVDISYPRVWNDEQDWRVNMTANKVSSYY